MIRKTLVMITVAALVFACKKNKNEVPNFDCSGAPKSYLADVKPIILSSCATNSGCHGAGSSNGPGPLLDYAQVFNDRAEVSEVVASGHMPLNGTLTLTEKSAIICWIASGAPEN